MDKYPSLYKVGKYLDKSEFDNQRKEIGQWVFYPKLVDALLNGDYYYLKPLHVELCITYKCNFSCSWCNCSLSRKKNTIDIDMELEKAKLLINNLNKNKIGIQWTGGEPLCYENILNIIEYASKKKVVQCLFTNGSLLTNEYINELSKSNLKFIRVSLNAISPDIHQRFHNLNNIQTSINTIKRTKQLIKKCYNTNIDIGLSFVYDSRNIDDFENCMNFIYSINVNKKSAISFAVIRVVNDKLNGVVSIKNNDFEDKINHFIYTNQWLKILNEVGCKLSIIRENHHYLLKSNPSSCLGGNIFSEISPNGDIFFCSEKYGDCLFKIGNTFENSLDNIWKSEQRKMVFTNYCNCYSNKKCPNNSRGAYFNSIIRQIDLFKPNNLKEVINWINSIQTNLHDYGHSFFI